ncbi:MAG: HAMP domain-containing histidine kinase [Pseudarcicella sp.]|nr:HAMP domain-containing histidine kinase [Pseudarcicella sp.]MBP6410228.1 HAMP domain-containing histidine kinase [Pseudarcicella sp.]
MQIRSRLTYQFTLIVSALLLISYLIIYFFTAQYYKDRFYSRLRKKGNTTAEQFINFDQVDSKLMKIISKSNRDVLLKENIIVYDTCNEKIYQSNDSVYFNIDLKKIKEVREKTEVRYKYKDLEIEGLVFATPNGRLVVFAGAIDQYRAENLLDLKRILIAMFLLLILILLISGWFFSGRALRPISEVIRQVDNLSPKRLEERLETQEPSDEIGQLVLTFNRLLGRTENAFQLQKTFIANVSHELKNPLTKISAQLEVSLLQERDKNVYQSTIKSVLEDTKELANITESLLELNKFNHSQYQESFKPVRIDEVLWDARSLTNKLDHNYKIVIKLENLPDDDDCLFIKGNEKLLKTGFKNLMENACKFSANKEALIFLKITNNSIQLEFLNNGGGIPEKDIPYIFQPFFRGKSTASAKGYGIGLSLVERIITLHKGTIQATSDSKEWTRFTVHFALD